MGMVQPAARIAQILALPHYWHHRNPSLGWDGVGGTQPAARGGSLQPPGSCWNHCLHFWCGQQALCDPRAAIRGPQVLC